AARCATRTGTKTVTSFRSIDRTVRYETSRQAGIPDAEGSVVQETRHFHEDTGETSSGRVKTDAEDYRYFPEPDLVPLAPSREWIEQLRADLPELPTARRRRLLDEWAFSELEMRDVINAGALDLIERTVAAGIGAQAARKWWMGELARSAREQEVELEDLPVTPAQIAELQSLVDGKKINDKL